MQSRGRVRHELCTALFVLEAQALDQDLSPGHQFQLPKDTKASMRVGSQEFPQKRHILPQIGHILPPPTPYKP